MRPPMMAKARAGPRSSCWAFGVVLALAPVVAHAVPLVVWIHPADGSTVVSDPDGQLCAATPPPWCCDFGESAAACMEAIVTLIDRSLVDFATFCTLAAPISGSFYEVVLVNDTGPCDVAGAADGYERVQASCDFVGDGVAYVPCTGSPERCAQNIVRAVARLAGLVDTTGSKDAMNRACLGCTNLSTEEVDTTGEGRMCRERQSSYWLFSKRVGPKSFEVPGCFLHGSPPKAWARSTCIGADSPEPPPADVDPAPHDAAVDAPPPDAGSAHDGPGAADAGGSGADGLASRGCGCATTGPRSFTDFASAGVLLLLGLGARWRRRPTPKESTVPLLPSRRGDPHCRAHGNQTTRADRNGQGRQDHRRHGG